MSNRKRFKLTIGFSNKNQYVGYSLNSGKRVGGRQGYLLELKYKDRSRCSLVNKFFIPRYTNMTEIRSILDTWFSDKEHESSDKENIAIALKRRVLIDCDECFYPLVWNALRKSSFCPVCEWS